MRITKYPETFDKKGEMNSVWVVVRRRMVAGNFVVVVVFLNTDEKIANSVLHTHELVYLYTNDYGTCNGLVLIRNFGFKVPLLAILF